MVISCADPARASRPPRHLAGFSFAPSLVRQHLTGQGSGLAAFTPYIRAPAARCAFAPQTHAATRPDPARAPCAHRRGLLGGGEPHLHRWRAIGTPPRLRASCVGNHAGERLWPGDCSPRQHWARATHQILFSILHFPSDPFTQRDFLVEFA